MNRGTSKGRETSILECLTRQIQIFRDRFCLDVIWKVILIKVKMDDTNLDPADLDFPRREVFVRSLEFALALAIPLQIVFCVRLLGE